MTNRNGYAGKISNSGAQRVQAPLNSGKKADKGVVKTGDDLRSGNSKKK